MAAAVSLMRSRIPLPDRTWTERTATDMATSAFTRKQKSLIRSPKPALDTARLAVGESTW